MGRVTAVTKGYEVGWFIGTTKVAWHKMMNIRFTATTRDATGDALMIVAIQHKGTDSLPTEFLRLRSVGDGYRFSADRTRDGKTNTVSVHHQMFAAMGTVKGDVHNPFLMTAPSTHMNRRTMLSIAHDVNITSPACAPINTAT